MESNKREDNLKKGYTAPKYIGHVKKVELGSGGMSFWGLLPRFRLDGIVMWELRYEWKYNC
jgi:hypothetical protein